ncbi:MAG: DUF1343 domain-containing protein [Chthoniobacterales bacterium]|nr:DUF1343 domain-containing protein [Chthoniobacterales bacterium]
MSRVVLPVDRLPDLWPARLRGRRTGALLHAASADSSLRPTLSVLEEMDAAGAIKLAALFGPQHGFETTTQDNMIEWSGYRHPRSGVPVHSLYGEHREPTDEMLDGLEVIFVDLVDVGARYYTFIWTMLLCIQAAARRNIAVVVADRPNPIDGLTTEGRPQRSDYLSFVGLHPLPVRHGKTIGELARQFQEELVPSVDLTVLPLEGWNRAHYHDETGLPWIMPSPNMPTPETAVVYPGMCLLEGTNLSEGRGTTRPFELFGAPWIDGDKLGAGLNALRLPGIHFRAAAFEPGFQKYAGQICRGAQLHVTDRKVFQPLRTGLEILRMVREMYPSDFAWKQPPYEYEHEKLPIEILCGRPVEKIFDETL